MSFLELEQIEKHFGGDPVVSGFSLKVEKGELVSFLGGSGCGKTTTLRMIAGYETPTGGTIRIDGVDVARLPARRRNIGMVFQSYALFPNMTAAGNIAFGLKIAGMRRSELQERVNEMLRLVHMEGLSQRYPHQLSGGQQQRVALARALAIRPKMLLLDEPLSALDARIRGLLREEIRSIQREVGITTIYVTHDQEEALSISDRVVVMNQGRIEQVGTPKEIYDSPATGHVAGFIGTLNILAATVRNREEGLLEVDGELIKTATPLRPLAEGAAVYAAVRPERITFDAGTASENRLHGTVRDLVFLGSTVRMVVESGANRLLVERFNEPNLAFARPGEQVTLSFAPQACIPIYAGADRVPLPALEGRV